MSATRPVTRRLTSAINRGALPGGRSALNALAQARFRRVDVLMIGDSNAAHNGYGFFGGFQKKLGERFGSYATSVDGMGSNGGAGSVPEYHTNNVVAPAVISGGPTAQTALFGGLLGLNNYAYLPDGSSQSNVATGTTTAVNAVGGIDITAQLRSHVVWASFATGAGSFKAGVRLGYSPFTVLASSAVVSTNTGEASLHRTTVDVAAGAGRTGAAIEAMITQAGSALTGPFFGVFHRLENVTRSAGVCVSKLTSTGGWSLYDMASDLLNASDATLAAILGEARYLQIAKGQTPIVVIAINSGVNDRNETSTPSLGPNPSNVPDSAAAYTDNLDAIANRIEGVYASKGWSLSELYWLLFPSHPISDPDDAELVSYRAAAKAWSAARPRASCVVLADYINSGTMTADSYYYNNAGTIEYEHLSDPSGYDALAQIVVDRIP